MNAKPAANNKPFIKEDRYLVFKRSDISQALTTYEKETLLSLAQKVFLNRKSRGKTPLECVVVESDWPNYNDVWESVERVDSGSYQALDATINNLTSTYGDNWYDGFIAAIAMARDGEELECIPESDILLLSEIAEDEMVKRKTKRNKKLHGQDELIQRMFDEGFFGVLCYDEVMESLREKGVIDAFYYCECDSCGNCFEVVKVGSPCDNCNEGTMQPQDVDPWD